MSAGACIGNACRGLPDGARVKINVGDDPSPDSVALVFGVRGYFSGFVGELFGVGGWRESAQSLLYASYAATSFGAASIASS